MKRADAREYSLNDSQMVEVDGCNNWNGMLAHKSADRTVFDDKIINLIN